MGGCTSAARRRLGRAPGSTTCEADPRLTFHLKGPDVVADLPATARIIDDEAERRPILAKVARVWRRTDVEEMVQYAPLIEVTIVGYEAATAA